VAGIILEPSPWLEISFQHIEQFWDLLANTFLSGGWLSKETKDQSNSWSSEAAGVVALGGAYQHTNFT